VWGYGVGIDLTRRDLQIASRNIKRPWEIGKSFDAAAPMGALKPASEIGHPAKGRIHLRQNGVVKQDGDLAQMIWNVPEVINQLSQQVGLAAGDVIMTGTPAGVGQIAVGDKLECEIEDVGTLAVTMAPMEKEYMKPA
jgi:fumarylpyruvate hydrolase